MVYCSVIELTLELNVDEYDVSIRLVHVLVTRVLLQT